MPEVLSAVCADGMNSAPSSAASTKVQSSAPKTTAQLAACAGIMIMATSKNALTLAQLSVQVHTAQSAACVGVTHIILSLVAIMLAQSLATAGVSEVCVETSLGISLAVIMSA